MNIALIFAGGTGQRMNITSKPKQFLELHGKPILIYTLEHFQNHKSIDSIVVVCLEEWIPYCREVIKKFNINKVFNVVSGGKNGQESIYNGLKLIHDSFPEDSIILIHDGVRPLIDGDIISKSINSVLVNGNAITVAPAIETIIKERNGIIDDILERKKCCLAKAPQGFLLKDIYNAHIKALKDQKNDFIDSASLMHHYGFKLYTVNDSNDNIKITTPIDFYLFKAIIDAKENMQILGLK